MRLQAFAVLLNPDAHCLFFFSFYYTWQAGVDMILLNECFIRHVSDTAELFICITFVLLIFLLQEP